MTDPDALIPADEEQRLAAVRRYDVLDTPRDGAFDRITALAARHFNVPISIVSIVDRDRIWFKSHHGVEVDEIGRDPGLCASAILQHEPWVVEDAAVDPRTLANPLVAGDFGLRFYAGVPLETRDGYSLGTLCLLDQQPRSLTDDETRTLQDMAAIVMDELELRLSARTVVQQQQALRELAEQTARTLQSSLLPPRLPDLPGVDLASVYLPAEAGEVGGDFYDAFQVGDDAWALVIGDVSGKGPGAAAVTALARHTIRTASLAGQDPGAILDVLNQALFLGRAERELDHFCTIALVILRPGRDGLELRAAAAAHPPALILRRGAGSRTLETAGPPVGWYRDARFTVTEAALAPGDALVLYTDGFSEARRDGELIGEDGLANALQDAAGEAAGPIADRLRALLGTGGVEARDDAAALVASVR